jgi:DNA-binding CsgD family transcriptional regulator
MNIVNGILDGQKYVEIGKSLHLSSNYVKQEASKLCRMLGVVSRLQLANYWNCELFQIGLKELGIYEARTH